MFFEPNRCEKRFNDRILLFKDSGLVVAAVQRSVVGNDLSVSTFHAAIVGGEEDVGVVDELVPGVARVKVGPQLGHGLWDAIGSKE